MPEITETIHLAAYNVHSLLVFCYGAAQKLGWTVESVAENRIVAVTDDPLSEAAWKTTLEVSNGEIIATGDINQIKRFKEAINITKGNASDSEWAEWYSRIEALKSASTIKPIQEKSQPDELNGSLHFLSRRPYITYGIIAINVIVFIAMLINGVSIIDPSGEEIVKWGANFGPYTYSGDWWRLITSVFVHIGIIHLLFNMYALFMGGTYLEPLLGKWRFLVAYLCSGVFASLVSLWWHNESVASAGASGAVFGIFGVFLALLSTNLVPTTVRRQLLQGIAIFVGYNLLYGMKSGVDNAAHIGGLISGLVIGYLFYFDLRKTEETGRTHYKPVLTCIVTVLCAFLYLRNSAPEVQPEDGVEFSKTMEHFAVLEEIALEAMQPVDTTSNEHYLAGLKKTALNDWVECVNLFENAEKLDLPPGLQSIRTDMLQYSKDRVQQTLLLIKAAEEQSGQYALAIDSIQTKIEVLTEKLKARTRNNIQ